MSIEVIHSDVLATHTVLYSSPEHPPMIVDCLEECGLKRLGYHAAQNTPSRCCTRGESHTGDKAEKMGSVFLWNQGQTSPTFQNSCINGPTKMTCVLQKVRKSRKSGHFSQIIYKCDNRFFKWSNLGSILDQVNFFKNVILLNSFS